MNDSRIRDVVIVGGGTAGWMAAAALSATMGDQLRIRLIESDEIGIVGVGEATIPAIRLFNGLVRIDEDEFIRATQGSFKLGIEFQNWGRIGESYMHVFGQIGQSLDLIEFWQYWLRGRREGLAGKLGEYSLNETAARAGKFGRVPPHPNGQIDGISYAFHFDASLYARFLRGHSERNGVVRTEGKIVGLNRDAANGFIRSVSLESGEEVAGELFIDCSGFRGLLIEQELQTGYVDWSHWLPSDRAIAVPTANVGPIRPFTQSIAHPAGWQWRIPLQHRTGNGHVFCSQFMSEDEAASLLLQRLDGKALADPRPLRFTTGRRKKFWNKNVVALGLSSGFMEPLESTSLHLVQSGISKLLAFFPDRDFDPVVSDEYNRLGNAEFERIRDFLVLHYKLTARDDSPLWRYTSAMSIPDSLKHKMEHFKRYGRIVTDGYDLFGPSSWLAVQLGQLNMPERHDPLVDHRRVDGDNTLKQLRKAMNAAADNMPTHMAFIRRHCAAS